MSNSDQNTDEDRHERTTRWAFNFFMGTLIIGLLMGIWMLISATFS